MWCAAEDKLRWLGEEGGSRSFHQELWRGRVRKRQLLDTGSWWKGKYRGRWLHAVIREIEA